MYEGFSDFMISTIDVGNAYDVKIVRAFLEKYHIDYIPEEVDTTVLLQTTDGELVGTGSAQGNIIKFVAVDEKFQGTNAFSKLVSSLTELLLREHRRIFIFTHPRNTHLFVGLGFTCIAEALPHYSLLEFGFHTISKFKIYLNSLAVEGKPEATALVMNCNPFTFGHQFLIEKAARENEVVYLFVVQTEKSVFPFAVRWDLVKKGTSHLPNVVMIKTDDYLVSRVSFPKYFLKDTHADEITANQARLDLMVFINHVAPTLNITKRYVGTEVYCVTTASYNKEMHKLFPSHGIEVIEVKRKALAVDDYISASKIRVAIAEDNWDAIHEKVPQSTYDYLTSDEAKPIIDKIKSSDSRH
jgi:[citrate (pro-3S)-lyase] ligase